MSLTFQNSLPKPVNISLASEIVCPEICKLSLAEALKIGFIPCEKPPDYIYTYKFNSIEEGEFYINAFNFLNDAEEYLDDWSYLIQSSLQNGTLLIN